MFFRSLFGNFIKIDLARILHRIMGRIRRFLFLAVFGSGMPVAGQDTLVRLSFHWGEFLPGMGPGIKLDSAHIPHAVVHWYPRNLSSWENVEVQVRVERVFSRTSCIVASGTFRPEQGYSFQDGIFWRELVSPVRGRNQIRISVEIPGVYRKASWRCVDSLDVRIILVSSSNEQRKSYRFGQEQPSFSERVTYQVPSGLLYRFCVLKTGVYRLTFETLHTLGIAGTPGMFRVWSSAGAPLPQRLDTSRAGIPPLRSIPFEWVDADRNGIWSTPDFLLFYAEGPVRWTWSSTEGFQHQRHPYDTCNYVYLEVGSSTQISSPVLSQEEEVSGNAPAIDYTWYLHVHERDTFNPLQMGRRWYGDAFYVLTEQTFPVSLPAPNLAGVPLQVDFRAIARSIYGQPAFQVFLNEQMLGTLVYGRTSTILGAPWAEERDTSWQVSLPGGIQELSFRVRFQKFDYSDRGYLDWIRVAVPIQLQWDGEPLRIWVPDAGSGSVATFRILLKVPGISPTEEGVRVWQVQSWDRYWSVPWKIFGNTLVFRDTVDSFTRWWVFDPMRVPEPVFVDIASWSGLRLLPSPEMLILTTRALQSATEELAQWHEKEMGMRTLVIPVEQVYLEFSGGKQDPTALRDLIAWFYWKPGSPLKYVLLVGDATYDYRCRRTCPVGNAGFVPAFMPEISIHPVASYLTDDFYAFLEPGEGANPASNLNTLDLAVGRIPARSEREVRVFLQKLQQYHRASTWSLWNLTVTFLADDGDFNLHLNDADRIAESLVRKVPWLIPRKIYLDAYPERASYGPAQVPDAHDAFVQTLEEGSLITSFTGHGSEYRLTREWTFSKWDVPYLRNRPRYTFFVTATCEFSRFDEPSITSGGEDLLFHPDGGAIGLLSTVRLVYAGANFNLASRFFRAVGDAFADRRRISIGEVVRRAKNASLTGANNRKFVLLGDPAMNFPVPVYRVQIDSLRVLDPGAGWISTDTLQPGDSVQVFLSLRNTIRQPVSLSGEGVAWMVWLDTPARVYTRGQETESPRTSFLRRDVYLLKMWRTISSPQFSFSFRVPLSAGGSWRNIRWILYARTPQFTAADVDTNFWSGGTLPSSLRTRDRKGPEITFWYEGNPLTENLLLPPDPVIEIRLRDPSGILLSSWCPLQYTLKKDGQVLRQGTLDHRYMPEEGVTTRGKAEYRLFRVGPGSYVLTVEACDGLGNRSIAETSFRIATEERLQFLQVVNFPNPFSEQTRFFIRHNMPYASLRLSITVFTISGRVVWHTWREYLSAPPILQDVEWDGRSMDGRKVGRGVYFYRVVLENLERPEERISTYGKMFVF